jgi:hypothetical protein
VTQVVPFVPSENIIKKSERLLSLAEDPEVRSQVRDIEFSERTMKLAAEGVPDHKPRKKGADAPKPLPSVYKPSKVAALSRLGQVGIRLASFIFAFFLCVRAASVASASVVCITIRLRSKRKRGRSLRSRTRSRRCGSHFERCVWLSFFRGLDVLSVCGFSRR